MTLAQKAAWHEKVSRRMAQMSTAEKIRALKKARKEKADAEGTSEQKTRLTPMEMMLALRARAEEKEKLAEEEQGTGFDFIRERNPPTPAVPVEKRKHASILKSAERVAEEKRRRLEQIAAEQEKANRKRIETEAAYRYELRKNLKPKDQGYSKKKTQEEIYKDLGLWALPRHDVEHTQEPEEEPKKQKLTDQGYSKKKTTEHIVKDYVEQQKKQKLKDQGYSKKKTTEDVLRDFGLWALP